MQFKIKTTKAQETIDITDQVEKAIGDVKKGLCLVQNEQDENLGYGKFSTGLAHDDRIVVKNKMDKGDFLRRERH